MTNDNASPKACFKCGVSKPRSDFYTHRAMSDGLLGKCKECTKHDARSHRLLNLEKIREYDRARAKNPERAKTSYAISNAWRKEDNRRSSAHRKVAIAIRSGQIQKKNCCICGSANSVAHHESYDNPIDVVWYCQIHHKERHKEMASKGIIP